MGLGYRSDQLLPVAAQRKREGLPSPAWASLVKARHNLLAAALFSGPLQPRVYEEPSANFANLSNSSVPRLGSDVMNESRLAE